jgi:hypothetical protein
MNKFSIVAAQRIVYSGPFMLFREMIAVYCQNTQKYTVWGKYMHFNVF